MKDKVNETQVKCVTLMKHLTADPLCMNLNLCNVKVPVVKINMQHTGCDFSSSSVKKTNLFAFKLP